MRKFIISLTLSICTFITCQGQNFEKIDSISTNLQGKYNIKGVGIVAVQGNEIIYQRTFGDANGSNPFTDSTRVYIASNTKAFTALAIAKLAHSSQLKYSDPITNYIPKKYFADSIEVEKITVKDLINHTHGLSNDPLTFRTAYSGEYPADLQQLLKFTIYSEDSLSKKFKYSNLGYLLLGIIIENVSGDNWQDYLKNEVLIPLNMSTTGTEMNFDPELEILPYDFREGEPQLKSRKSVNTLHAAGGIYSTLPDMAKWLGLFTSDSQKKIDPQLLKKYLNNITVVDEKEGGGLINMKTYGNGWFFGDLINKKSIYYSFGRFKGYESVISFDPLSKRGVYIFVNESQGGVYLAAVLSSYFYFISENNSKADELINPILEILQEVYSTPTAKLSEIFYYKDSHSLSGIYYSPKYGTLIVDKTPDGYTFQIGKMKSLGYAGKTKNQLLVEWTPGIIEYFTIETKNNNIKLIYDDFGEFLKQ